MGPEPSALLWASFVLAKEFGWTPQQVQSLTPAQVQLYLEMLVQNGNGEDKSETAT